jgi:membrane protease YdiL (CAAX protease family)
MTSIEAHATRKALLVCLKGAVIAVAYSLAIAVLPRLNVVIFPQLYWFVLPVAVLCWKFLSWSKSSEYVLGSISLAGEQAAVISVIAGLTLALLALVLSGNELSISGLPGTSLQGASDGLRLMWSFFDLVSSAFVEESAVRGWIQLRLQRIVRTVYAELAADALFVLLHILRFATPGNVSHALRELILVLTLGVVNGRITSKSQSIVWPIVVHAICNAAIFVAAVVVSRP